MMSSSKLLQRVPLIDGHNDLAYMIRAWNLNRVERDDFNANCMPFAHTDWIRMKQGLVGAQFWSAYVPCPAPASSNDFSTSSHFECLVETLQQVDLIHLLIEKYPDTLGFASTSAEVWDIFKSGRIASLIGIEGLHQICNSASVMRSLHRLGVRYITLTHESNNLYADAGAPENEAHGGLSEAGVQMLLEMNRTGMIIDLSHTSSKTQKQTLDLSKAPVIFSHSSCAALCSHHRNVSDEMLSLLKQNKGVIMISFICKLTDNDQSRATMSRVADHILHVHGLIGSDHIGIGSDFDGMMTTPKGLEDVSRYPDLFDELGRRGLSDSDLMKIAGLNILRVLDDVETVSSQLSRMETMILCDDVREIFDQDTRNMIASMRLGPR